MPRCSAIFFNSFTMALVSRVIVGVGIGLSHPFSAALLSRFFSGQKRANLQGAATLIMNLAGVFYQVIIGGVCLMNVNYTWLVHLFTLVLLVMILVFFQRTRAGAMFGGG